MKRTLLFRVQAADGHGPWRPGLGRFWMDEARTSAAWPVGIVEAFGLEWRGEIPQGWHAGCACRSLAALREWFTPPERACLSGMGYQPVALYAEKIIRENADQVIFARRLPLADAALALDWESGAPLKRAAA